MDDLGFYCKFNNISTYQADRDKSEMTTINLRDNSKMITYEESQPVLGSTLSSRLVVQKIIYLINTTKFTKNKNDINV